MRTFVICEQSRHGSGKDGLPLEKPVTYEPIRDRWLLTKRGDKRFDPEGNPVWICPECRREHGI